MKFNKKQILKAISVLIILVINAVFIYTTHIKQQRLDIEYKNEIKTLTILFNRFTTKTQQELRTRIKTELKTDKFFIKSLKGKDGQPGKNGINGVNGKDADNATIKQLNNQLKALIIQNKELQNQNEKLAQQNKEYGRLYEALLIRIEKLEQQNKELLALSKLTKTQAIQPTITKTRIKKHNPSQTIISASHRRYKTPTQGLYGLFI